MRDLIGVPPTATQLKVLLFMHTFFLANDQLPAMHIVADKFGWSSVNAADEHKRALMARDLLANNALGKPKFTVRGRALVALMSGTVS